jgi:hypothetical protein
VPEPVTALANTVHQVRWDTPYRLLASLAGLAALGAGLAALGAGLLPLARVPRWKERGR